MTKKSNHLAAILLVLTVPFAAMAEGETPPVERPPVAEPTTPPMPGSNENERQRDQLKIRQLRSIDFGVFAAGQGGGAVTISPSGARIPSGNVSLLNTGFSGPAEFEITGQPGEMVTIYLPERVILGKNGDGSDAEITNLTIAPDATVTLDSRGMSRVKIGGSMRLSGNIGPGAYNGQFDVDVRYLR